MENLIKRYPVLEECREDIKKAAELMLETYKKGGKILLAGNGGSCADCDHIVGELMKGFLSMRRIDKNMEDRIGEIFPEDKEHFKNTLQGSLPAISLPSQSALLSAFANDVDADMVYAQLVYGYGKAEDLLIAMSTSGNSKNVVNAAKIAKVKNVKVLSFTGKKDSKLSAISDVTIKVPETETFKIQELHLPVYHYLCAEIENILFGE